MTMTVKITGGSSLSVDELENGLRKLFEGYGFGKVVIIENKGREPYDGFVQDESVEIDFTSYR